MVKVNFSRNLKGEIISFYGEGHALFDEYGKDIVCAAVSTLFQHTLLALKRYLKVKVEVDKEKEKGVIKAKIEDVPEEVREKVDLVLETLLLSLKEIEKIYPKNLKVLNY